MAASVAKMKPIFVVGPSGSGKSHYIQQLARQERRTLLRCPCRKDRTLREQRAAIHEWALRAESTLLWIEGADDLTPEAQSFLRRILETYAPSVRFCLEGQTIESIQEPILSRCEIMRLSLPTHATLIARLSARQRAPAATIVEDIGKYMQIHKLHSWRQAEAAALTAANFPGLWIQAQAHTNANYTIQTPSIKLYCAAANPWTVIMNAFSGLDDESKTLIIDCIGKNGNPWALLNYIQLRLLPGADNHLN
jgi:hypothetical protein